MSMHGIRITRVSSLGIALAVTGFALAFACALLHPAAAGAADLQYIFKSALADGGTASGYVLVNTADPNPMTAVDYLNINITDPSFPGQPFLLDSNTLSTSYSMTGSFVEFHGWQDDMSGYHAAFDIYVPESILTLPYPDPSIPIDLVALAGLGGYTDRIYDYNAGGSLVASTNLPEPRSMLLIVSGLACLAGMRKKFTKLES